jgi:hypothetical protein
VLMADLPVPDNPIPPPGNPGPLAGTFSTPQTRGATNAPTIGWARPWRMNW